MTTLYNVADIPLHTGDPAGPRREATTLQVALSRLLKRVPDWTGDEQFFETSLRINHVRRVLYVSVKPTSTGGTRECLLIKGTRTIAWLVAFRCFDRSGKLDTQQSAVWDLYEQVESPADAYRQVMEQPRYSMTGELIYELEPDEPLPVTRPSGPKLLPVPKAESGRPVRAVLKSSHTWTFHTDVVLVAVDEDDVDWRFHEDGAELDYNWDVIYWAYIE